MKVLITQRVLEQKFHNVDAVEQNYDRYLRSMGFDVFPVPNTITNISPYIKLDPALIILSGGGDIGGIQESRDNVERMLLDAAVKDRIPVLGICRGMQFINTYFGGSIINVKDKTEEVHVGANHPILSCDSKYSTIIGNGKQANSFHNQGLTQAELSSHLKAFARSPQGIIEGVYHPSLPIIGVQWHPERDFPNPEINEGLIKLLIATEPIL